MNDITLTLSGTSPLASAPKNFYYRQAPVILPIPTFTPEQTGGFLCQMGYIYASGDYSYLGPSSGRMGKYQFDYVALQMLGIAKSTVISNADFRFDFNWLGMHGGPRSTSTFLSNVELQDDLALRWAKINYESLYNSGGILATDTLGQRSGMLAVAHFIGAQEAGLWRNISTITTDLNESLPGIYMAGRYGTEILSVE